LSANVLPSVADTVGDAFRRERIAVPALVIEREVLIEAPT
jgi:hypothetical protein